MGYVFHYDFIAACLRFFIRFFIQVLFLVLFWIQRFFMSVFFSFFIQVFILSACWSPGGGWAAEQLRGDILVVGRCMWLILRKLGDGLLVLRMAC